MPPPTRSRNIGGSSPATSALHDVDVARITTHTLDVLYAKLAARGVASTHRPCRRGQAGSMAPGVAAGSASGRPVITRARARPGHRVTTSRAATAVTLGCPRAPHSYGRALRLISPPATGSDLVT